MIAAVDNASALFFRTDAVNLEKCAPLVCADLTVFIGVDHIEASPQHFHLRCGEFIEGKDSVAVAVPIGHVP